MDILRYEGNVPYAIRDSASNVDNSLFSSGPVNPTLPITTYRPQPASYHTKRADHNVSFSERQSIPGNSESHRTDSMYAPVMKQHQNQSPVRTEDIHPFWYQNNKPFGLRDSPSRFASRDSDSLHSYSSESSDLKKPPVMSGSPAYHKHWPQSQAQSHQQLPFTAQPKHKPMETSGYDQQYDSKPHVVDILPPKPMSSPSERASSSRALCWITVLVALIVVGSLAAVVYYVVTEDDEDPQIIT